MADRTKRSTGHRRKRDVNYTFFVMVLTLLAFGIIMVFSASSPIAHYNNQDAMFYFRRQLIFGLFGLFFMSIVSRMNYKVWYKWYIGIGVVTLVLLFLVPVIGVEVNGAKRWLKLGPISIQPSEIAKVSMVIIMSRLLTDYGHNIKNFFKGFCLMMVVPATLGIIVFLEDHLSGSIIIILVGVVLAYVAGARFKQIALTGIGVGVPVAIGAVAVAPYRVARVMSFLDPFADARGAGWQVVQSLYAIGSGGLFGVGLGQSREKYLYLPEPHTDFIFSVICEELGFLGALLVIVMFAILIVTGYKIALNAPDKFSSLLVTGIVTLIALQVIFNIAVVTSAMPCTGITLPFFSYGGSSLVINLVEMGIVLNVSRYTNKKL